MTAPLAACFSKELALESTIPTHVHRNGYFRQHLAADGAQMETPADWSPEAMLEALPHRAFLPDEEFSAGPQPAPSRASSPRRTLHAWRSG